MGLGQAKSMPDLCREMFKFHLWRQERVSSMLMEVDARILSEQLSGSFSSLNIILNHIVWAEMVWLGRVDNTAVAAMQDLDVKGMLAVWKAASEKWTTVLERAQDADFSQCFVYFNSQGERFENSLAEIVMHMIDHCSYHTGQMMNAIRGFGMEPVPTNLIHYLRA